MDLNLPLLPLRDIVVFPGMIVPLFLIVVCKDIYTYMV